MEPIAIVGIGCRLPGANNAQAYWELLRSGKNQISEIPKHRWDIDLFYSSDPKAVGKMSTRWGGFLDNIEDFDAPFFSISPREAVQIDPQQRILLEVAWEALEDAGIVESHIAKSNTGVFIGIMANDYSRSNLNNVDLIDVHTGTGNLTYCIAANRISYLLDLRGPSVAIDTACSSSLVAVNLACQSLHSGQCSIALAGGVNIMLWPWSSIYFSKAGFMAPDGQCKTFDAKANGFVRGEGAAIVVLKPLSKALFDGDSIYALIMGSAVNQDGRSNGITAPNRLSQEEVLREAYKQANIAPNQVQYVEAHGTGTALGDPIEVRALASVLSQGRNNQDFCRIGSVKTNIGHLEAAAGIAGLVKVALSLKNKEIPPSLNFETPNPNIPFSEIPFKVQQHITPWPKSKTAIAGVSAFGFGGTNAHAVLQESPKIDINKFTKATLPGALLAISSRSAKSLRTLATSYLEYLSNNDASIEDICYSASLRRTHHNHRLAIVGENKEEIKNHLSKFLNENNSSKVAIGQKAITQPKVVFSFAGQGTQWWAMGRNLLKNPTFRDVIEKCDLLLSKYVTWSLLDELEADQEKSRINNTEIAQPAIFAFQVGLVEMLASLGVTPNGVIGHSMGEVSAAYVAGILSLEEAVKVIAYRGKIMQRATGKGKMAAVRLSLSESREALLGYENKLSVAAHNSPGQSVLSGDSTALNEVINSLNNRGISTRFLGVNYAFHSPQMTELESELVSVLGSIKPKKANLQMVSTLTGLPVGETDFNASYWGEHLKSTVLFSEATEWFIKNGYNTFLEVSPQTVLANSITDCLKQNSRTGYSFGFINRQENEHLALLEALGQLYVLGYPIDWANIYPEGGRFVKLPLYAWDRERFWLEGKPETTLVQQKIAPTDHPLLGTYTEVAHPSKQHIWRIELNNKTCSYFDDHRIQNTIVMNSLASMNMVLAAASKTFGDNTYFLKDIEFRKAIFLSETDYRSVEVILSDLANQEASFHIYSQMDNKVWVLNIVGKVVIGSKASVYPLDVPLETIKDRCKEVISGETFYEELKALGNQFGPTFQGVKSIWRGIGEAVGQIQMVPSLAEETNLYHFHPAILDACAHPILTTDVSKKAFMPIRIGHIKLYDKASEDLWSYSRIRSTAELSKSGMKGDVYVFNKNGDLVAELLDSHLQYLDSIGETDIIDKWTYELQWQAKEKEPSTNVGNYLIFADKKGLAQEITSLLKEKQQKVILVHSSEDFQNIDATNFQVNPRDKDQISTVIQQVAEVGFDHILYLWNLDAEELSESVNCLSNNTTHLTGLIYLIQSLVSVNWNKIPQVWSVTQDSQAIGQINSPMQACSWGLGRTIAQEYSTFWGGTIDISSSMSLSEKAIVLLNELSSKDMEDQIAFYQSKRYVARLIHKTVKVKDNAKYNKNTYLITGGLGSLGLQVAEWLAQQGAKRLILMSRRSLPLRKNWDKIPLASELGQQIISIKKLEDLGAEVHLACVDVSDYDQLSAFLSEYQKQLWPEIRGVFHLAGLATLEPIESLTEDKLINILKPKILGSWFLHNLLPKEDLDFFVLFSSSSAILNSPQLGHYAAGNAFLDALAQYRHQKGKPALSINWGAWSEVGMAARSQQQDPSSLRSVEAISPKQALELLSKLMQQDLTQIAVIPNDWNKYRQLYSSTKTSALLTDLLAKQEVQVLTSQEIEIVEEKQEDFDKFLFASISESRNWLKQYLTEIVAKVLDIDLKRIDSNQPLNSMGLDSLMAVELRNQIEVKTTVNLQMLSFLQGNNIEQLIDEILVNLGPVKNQMLVKFLQEQVAKVLSMNSEQVDINQPLNSLGLDSLMAVDLRNSIESKTGVSLPMLNFLQGNSVVQIVEQLIQELCPNADTSLNGSLEVKNGSEFIHNSFNTITVEREEQEKQQDVGLKFKSPEEVLANVEKLSEEELEKLLEETEK